MVLSGSLRVQLDDHIELLGPGDSVFYDSSHPHGMVAAGGTDCTFLAVVFKPVAELPDAEGELPAEPAPVVRPADAKTAGAKYDGLIYHNFAREKIDENGCLTGHRASAAGKLQLRLRRRRRARAQVPGQAGDALAVPRQGGTRLHVRRDFRPLQPHGELLRLASASARATA